MPRPGKGVLGVPYGTVTPYLPPPHCIAFYTSLSMPKSWLVAGSTALWLDLAPSSCSLFHRSTDNLKVVLLARNLMAQQDLGELGFRKQEAGNAGAAAQPGEQGREGHSSQEKRRAGFVAGLPSR